MKKILTLGLKLVSIVNKERSLYNLTPVVYDHKLLNEINNFTSTKNASWFYDSSPNNSTFYLKSGGKLIPREQHLNGVIETPFSYLFRDTYKNSIPLIFKFRANQRSCFDWKKCDKKNFYLFSSCTKKLELRTRKKCSFSYAYYPLFVYPSLKSFACISLDFQGTYVPESLKNVQKKSFWCYSKNFTMPKVDYFLDY